jgi:hypothetical protein
MAGLDLTFVKSRRTSLTFSGGYNQRIFGTQAGTTYSLYNGNGLNGSMEYSYAVTEHTSIGVLVLHQDTTYQGGEVFGNRQRTQIESGLFSVGARLSPTLSVTVYGGPQYIHSLGQSSVEAGAAHGFQGAGGGNVTEEVRNTALTFSIYRAVSDGGGLYTSVVNTNAILGVRRRLVGHWDAGVHVGAARVDTSLFQLINENTEALTGGIDINRPLRNGSAFHISYATIHQLSNGIPPVVANFDRNQVSIGFDYRLKAIPLGR